MSTTEITKTEQITIPHLPDRGDKIDADRLLEAFLSRRCANTRKAYSHDLEMLARWMDAQSAEAAIQWLLEAGPGKTNEVLLLWQDHMRSEGLAPSTRNRRLAAVRAALKLGRTLGMVNWEPSVENEPVTTLRDTAGPGEKAYRKMLAAAESTRNEAILRLLHDLGLRRGELTRMDLEDYDADRGRVRIHRKGREETEWMYLPESTEDALTHWLQDRPPGNGPIFCSVGSNNPDYFGHRLLGQEINRIVNRIGEQVGVDTTPHGLRHTAITRAVEKNGLDGAMAFAGHKNPATTRKYLDNLEDKASATAHLVAEED